MRFYEELNDFLPAGKKKITFEHSFLGNPSIKDVIESLGIPHTEVDLILVNGKSVSFKYQLKNQDQVSVYPVFERLNIASVTRLRQKPLRVSRFILDVHLGKLARYLRLLGFDTLYRNDYNDAEIVLLAQQSKRIILTRDIGLLKHKNVSRGYWLRATQPKQQAHEILQRFDLYKKIQPFARCLDCNGKVARIHKKTVQTELQKNTNTYYEDFSRCRDCKKIYWQGSHYSKLQKLIQSLMINSKDAKK